MGFKKNSSAFYVLNSENKLVPNKDYQFLISNDDEEEFDPEIEAIYEEIDSKIGFCNFSNLDEFVKFNEKRKVLIDEAIKEYKKGKNNRLNKA
jgi:hypothetical protein